ncbi:dockerin type I domain-containing protein [Lewinella sp. W8]|uniref:dockerin type I domain-containing protein n=1 Tax=Lewinella sp. W8 TaxID=2528208 RepID=UPI00106798FE|nr:dockerin type I domain-containing protein [Lewinella sp. W8]MTB52491.1 hypothetical protein [Lewinella sp. W8]
MTNRFLYDLRKQWLIVLLAIAAPVMLRGQCEGPFNLGCQASFNLTLNEDCQAEVNFAMLVTGAPSCLTEDNFAVVVQDSNPTNGPIVDGEGRFQVSIQGQGNPDLAGFTCWGTVNTKDNTAPVITGLSATPLHFGCDQLIPLPAPSSYCYRVDGATGAVIAGTLDEVLLANISRTQELPVITDACGGEIEVCVTENQSPEQSGECRDTTTIVRTFTARRFNVEGDELVRSAGQVIRFIRPELTNLQGVPNVSFEGCGTSRELDGVPPPKAEDYPFFLTPSGLIHLSPQFCQYQVTVSDGTPWEGCGEDYAFVRTYRVIDWCSGRQEGVFTQVVQVGDRQGPEITVPVQDLDFDGIPDEGPLKFSTNLGCAAIISVRTGGVSATDACTGEAELLAFVYPDGNVQGPALGPYEVFGENVQSSLTAPLPVGEHLIRYVASDPCENDSRVDVWVEIFDGAPPTALCEAGLTVSLNTNGFAIITAAQLDAGSVDDCSPTLNFRIGRANENNEIISPLANTASFLCADLGTVRLALEVRDDKNNANLCWTTVTVEDKLAPECLAPPNFRLNCQTFNDNFPSNLATEFALDPVRYASVVDAVFGAARGRDNCPVDTITQGLSGTLNECGTGRFTRSFTVRDGGGLTQTDVCLQRVDVVSLHDYSIRFPGDEAYACGDLPSPEELFLTESGCELLTLNTAIDTLVADASSCYKLRLTHEVINWCEYNGNTSAINVPRDANGDGNLLQPTILHVLPVTDNDLTDDRLVLDQDLDPNSGNEIRELIPNYGNSTQRGFFRYVQFVRVYDEEAPALEVVAPENGLAFTLDCTAEVTFNFSALDDCSTATTRLSIDLDAVDVNEDGQWSGVDFDEDRVVDAADFTGDAETGIEVEVGNLPIGTHLARLTATDDCGNTRNRYVPFEVEDGKAPTPSCLGFLTATLSPNGGDGGIATLWATDFVASPPEVCTSTDIAYSLYTEAEASAPGFTPATGRNQITFDCANLGEVILRVYAFSAVNGRNDYCNVSVTVATNDESICADRQGQIAGQILNLEGDPMADIEILNAGLNLEFQQTDGNGEFSFTGLREGNDYTIQPYYNFDMLNGVTTLDILLIGRYLLEQDDNLTAYQLIAADANRSGAVTILDLIQIRRVILGLDADFDNNTSWRFIPTDYFFPNPRDPWEETFPEVANFNNLFGNEFVEFTAVKVGDVNGSAEPTTLLGFPGEEEGRIARPVLALNVEQPAAGTVTLFADDTLPTAGMQFTLELSPGTTVVPGQIGESSYRRVENQLSVSFVPEAGNPIDPERALLSIVGEAGAPLPALTTRRGGLRPEVYGTDYQVYDLRIRLREEEGNFALREGLAVYPNPFYERAVLDFDWPATEAITLRVTGPDGRLYEERELPVQRGFNQFSVERPLRAPQTGVLLFTLDGARGGSRSHRVIVGQ